MQTGMKIFFSVLALGLAAAGGYFFSNYHVSISQKSETGRQTTNMMSDATKSMMNALAPAEQKATGLMLDLSKRYGDKYQNGILPVGDKKYSTTGAKKGSIYLCRTNFVPEGQAGAQSRGPWFIGTSQWDLNKKIAVQGKVNWQSQMNVKVEGEKRVITTNDLPKHATGVFPVSSSDAAYQYDRNPNTIQAQSLTYTLNADPTYGEPQCMGGEVGVMLSGAALFNGFDAGGRDAGAWEIQDGCQGHPQSSGEYHYHTLSSCIADVAVDTVIGYALDGFPITGPKVSDGNFLSTDDLDECHGIVSEVLQDGKKVSTYHYVMTKDFPYSASCFRGEAIRPPGIPEGQGGMQMQQKSGQMGPQGGGQMPPRPGQGSGSGGMGSGAMMY